MRERERLIHYEWENRTDVAGGARLELPALPSAAQTRFRPPSLFSRGPRPTAAAAAAGLLINNNFFLQAMFVHMSAGKPAIADCRSPPLATRHETSERGDEQEASVKRTRRYRVIASR